MLKKFNKKQEALKFALISLISFNFHSIQVYNTTNPRACFTLISFIQLIDSFLSLHSYHWSNFAEIRELPFYRFSGNQVMITNIYLSSFKIIIRSTTFPCALQFSSWFCYKILGLSFGLGSFLGKGYCSACFRVWMRLILVCNETQNLSSRSPSIMVILGIEES